MRTLRESTLTSRRNAKLLEMKIWQFFIDLGLLGLCYYYAQVGLALRAGTDDTYILLKACASEMGIPEIVDMSEEAIFLFSALTTVMSNMGMFGLLNGRVAVLQTYSLLVYVLLSLEMLFFATVHFHVDHLKGELETCLSRRAIRKYDGPWSDDPTTLSYAINSFQLKYTCCGITDPNDFENVTGWNRTWIDNEGNKVEAVRPWTCCRLFNMSEENKIYDPSVQTFEVVTGTGDDAFLQNDRCTLDIGAVNKDTCTKRFAAEIEDKVLYCFVGPGFLLVFTQIVGCTLGTYNSKATRNSKLVM